MRQRAHATIILAALLLVVPSLAWTQSPTLVVTPTSVIGGVNSTGVINLGSAAPEGGLVVQLLVIRFPGESSAASVPATVIVPAQQSSASFLVTTTPVASSRTVVISFVAAGATNTARLTVLAPSPSQVRLPDIEDGFEKLIAELKLSGAAPAGGLVVPLSSSNPSAATVPASISVDAGKANAKFQVNPKPVAQPTAVTITAGTGGSTAAALLTVKPPVLTSLQIPAITAFVQGVIGGTITTATIVLNDPAPAGFVVQLSSSNPALASIGANHPFPPGTSSTNARITTFPVDRSTEVTLTATMGSVTRTATLMVFSPRPTVVTISPNDVIGGGRATVEVTLSGPAPAGGLPVSINVTGTTPVNAPATLLVPADQTSKTFTITTNRVSQNTSVNVRATVLDPGTGSETSRSATLTIRSVSPSSLTLTPGTTYGPVGGVHAQVVLNATAPPGGLPVQLTSSHAHLVQVPAMVTIPAGQTSLNNIGIAYSNVFMRTTVTITATAAGVSKTAQLVINP